MAVFPVEAKLQLFTSGSVEKLPFRTAYVIRSQLRVLGGVSCTCMRWRAPPS